MPPGMLLPLFPLLPDPAPLPSLPLLLLAEWKGQPPLPAAWASLLAALLLLLLLLLAGAATPCWGCDFDCISSHRSGRKAEASGPHQAGSRCIR